MFEEVEKRNRTFSCIRDYVTTTATTQMGQGATEVSHIDGWDIPLMPKDGRNPPSQPDHPGWDPSPIRMMNDKQQREADAQRAQQQQQQTGPSGSTFGGHDGSSSAAGSAPPPKAPPSKARPSTPPARKDWVISSGTKRISFQDILDARSKELRVHHIGMDGRAGSLPTINHPRPSSSSCQHFRFSTLGTIFEESDRVCLHGLRNLQSGGRDGGHRVHHLREGLAEVLQPRRPQVHADADRVLFVDCRNAHDARASRRECRQPI